MGCLHRHRNRVLRSGDASPSALWGNLHRFWSRHRRRFIGAPSLYISNSATECRSYRPRPSVGPLVLRRYHSNVALPPLGKATYPYSLSAKVYRAVLACASRSREVRKSERFLPVPTSAVCSFTRLRQYIAVVLERFLDSGRFARRAYIASDHLLLDPGW